MSCRRCTRHVERACNCHGRAAFGARHIIGSDFGTAIRAFPRTRHLCRSKTHVVSFASGLLRLRKSCWAPNPAASFVLRKEEVQSKLLGSCSLAIGSVGGRAFRNVLSETLGTRSRRCRHRRARVREGNGSRIVRNVPSRTWAVRSEVKRVPVLAGNPYRLLPFFSVPFSSRDAR